MKKHLLNLGLFITIFAPIVAVVSCKKTAPKIKPKITPKTKLKTKRWKVREDGVFEIEKNNEIRDKNFGLGNYKNASATNTEILNEKEDKSRRSTGKIFAPHFQPQDILGWNPNKYQEGDYVRSTTLLKKREFVLENISGHKNTARFYAMDTMRGNTSSAGVGTLTRGVKDSQIMQGLQYMTDMIAFGGSAGEGLVYLPRAQDIDSYHRMGIKVHATIFFAPSENGGSPLDYKKLIGENPQKAADQLVKMAKYYGFDGWFINSENSEPDNWADFMKIWHKKAKKAGIEISYYQNGNGGPVYEAGNDAYDVWFNDYSVQQRGTPVYKKDKFGGLTSEILKYVLPKDYSELSHPYGYNPSSIYSGAGNSFWLFKPWENGSYYKDEKSVRTFYNGVDASKKIIVDPRLSTDDSLSKYYREYTPFISHKSFSTSFNKGEGDFFNLNGTPIKSTFFTSGYSNMSLQDYLPTWKYVIDVLGSDGTLDKSKKIGNSGINIEHKETKDAWFGSDALVYQGTIEKDKMITNKLFASNIKLEEKDNFSIMYKGDVVPSLAVWTKESNKFKLNILDGNLDKGRFANKYHKVTYDLSSLKGKQMTSFGIALKNKTNDKLDLTNFVLGKMSFNVKKSKTSKKIEINNMTNGGEWITPSNKKNIRLKLGTTNKDIKGYFVYKNNKAFNKKELIGISNTSSMLLSGLDMEKISYVSLVPFDENNNLFSEIKITLKGDKLNFKDDSKWSHKTFDTNKYGFTTGHGFVGKATDNEGGTYLINDQVQVMHINKTDTLEKTGNYKKIIFAGKPTEGNHRGEDGATFSTLFVGKNKKIFIGRRYGGNGLYVFQEGMAKAKGEWAKYEKNNSIFKGEDNKGEMEYITKVFEQKDGSIILISSLGNVKRINSSGVLDTAFYKSVINAKNKTEIEKISITKIGEKTIIKCIWVEGSYPREKYRTVEKVMNSNNDITDSNFNLGYILDKKEFDDRIVFVVAQLINPEKILGDGKPLKVFVKVYDKKTKKIKSSDIYINEEFMKPSRRFQPNSKKIKAFDKRKLELQGESDKDGSYVLSSDGKYLIFTASKHHHGRKVEDKSYILVLEVKQILANPKIPIDVKATYIKKSVDKTFGKPKEYGGDFKIMIPIGDFIYYGTSDFGRIGAIKVDYIKLENTSLVNLKDTIYKFEKPDGKKIGIITIQSFKKGGMPVNPTKNINT